MSPDFTGVVDAKLETDEYMDPEDAKTEIFQFESASRQMQSGVRRRLAGSAVARRNTMRVRRKSRIFEFNKSGEIDRKADESLKALRKATNKSVSAATNRRRMSFKSIVATQQLAASSSKSEKQNPETLPPTEHQLKEEKSDILEGEAFGIHGLKAMSVSFKTNEVEKTMENLKDEKATPDETVTLVKKNAKENDSENFDDKFGIDSHVINYDYF